MSIFVTGCYIIYMKNVRIICSSSITPLTGDPKDYILAYFLYFWFVHPDCIVFLNFWISEAFGAIELVQLPTDPESGHCKGLGLIQVSINLDV